MKATGDRPVTYEELKKVIEKYKDDPAAREGMLNGLAIVLMERNKQY